MLHFLLLLLAAPVHAAELAGVSAPDTVSVGGQTLVLNGLGLREKYYIDVYVGGLYLPTKTTSSSTAIEQDVAKRLLMHFVYRKVTADQLAETFREGFAKDPGGAALQDEVDQLCGWMETMVSEDQAVFDYVPGQGTTVTVKGVSKGTIAGAPFMEALWRVYLGGSPPTEKLKRGMMGK